MTVRVAVVETVTIPLGTPLAKVADTGDVQLWPGGIGEGPLIAMSVRDWEQLKAAADSAIRVRRQALALGGYRATEGNGDEL